MEGIGVANGLIGFLTDTQQTTCKYFGEIRYINRLRLIILKPKQWGKTPTKQ